MCVNEHTHTHTHIYIYIYISTNRNVFAGLSTKLMLHCCEFDSITCPTNYQITVAYLWCDSR